MPRHLFPLILLGFFALPCLAELGGRQLADFRAEAEAYNRQDPFANTYRAGYYNGYLSGLVDALQGRRLCFRDCPCEIDKLVAEHLARHPEASEQPVTAWLVPLLETSYPCAARAD